jgi:hypothetical protein
MEMMRFVSYHSLLSSIFNRQPRLIEKFPDRRERTTVDRRRSTTEEGLKMFGGRIAFMPGEAITGILGIIRDHHPVTGHFGDDRCGGDDERVGIPIDDRELWVRTSRYILTIDQDEIRSNCQGFKGKPHGTQGGLKDIESVDLIGRNDANTKGDRLSGDFLKEDLTTHGGEALGVVETGQVNRFYEDNGSGNDRTGERTTTRLINTGENPDTLVAKPIIKESGSGTMEERRHRYSSSTVVITL